MKRRWKYVGVRNHIFEYNTETGWLTCGCGKLGTRVSAEQSVPVTERHVRFLAKQYGSVVLEELN